MEDALARQPSVRDRILAAAYKLFSERGIGATGIDAIVAESGCAKSSLYNNFDSKEELALAFLQEREQVWTRDWLEKSVHARASTAEGRLLAIFDVFDEWFREDDFEGCSFVNVLLESPRNSIVRAAAADHLANIREIVHGFAEQAKLVKPTTFANTWHMLMKGSIVSRGEGNREAAVEARRAGHLLLESWARSW